MIKNLIIFLTSIIILVVCINSSDNLFKKISAQHLSNKTFVLITNDSIYTCSSLATSNYSNALNNNSNSYSNSNFSWNPSYKSGIMVKFGVANNSKIHNLCPFSSISFYSYCPFQIANSNTGYSTCKLNGFHNNKLNQSNFDKDGNLIADTKFNKQYSFEIKRSNNSTSSSASKTIVNIDLSKHIQNNLPFLNSPRLKILRENVTGMPDMTSAKNQEIIWTGNIKNYYNKPTDNYNNETYMALQFNTGRHTDEKNSTSTTSEERSFGILFDVSNSSNPNLLEYRGDGGIYTKYNYDLIKQLAGKDFVLYSLNDTGSPHFINDLLSKNNVKLKIKTFLTKDNKRVIETYIDNGSGRGEVPYWTLKDLAKLKDDERISDKNGFIKVTTQGSGYVIARTDNIDTRPTSFQSYIIGD